MFHLDNTTIWCVWTAAYHSYGSLQFWAGVGGTKTVGGYWGQIAIDLLKPSDAASLRASARQLALFYTALYDNNIAGAHSHCSKIENQRVVGGACASSGQSYSGMSSVYAACHIKHTRLSFWSFHGLSFVVNLTLFLLCAVWYIKYTRLFWRPITAITQGDGVTPNDPTWTPFLTTPPHPECALDLTPCFPFQYIRQKLSGAINATWTPFLTTLQ